MFKKTIVILACGALIAPVAFAQTRSTHKKQTTAATEQPITVTGTIIKMTTGEGSVANYQPFKTLVVREDRSNTPGSQQERQGNPNRDQTRRARGCLLCEHRRFTPG